MENLINIKNLSNEEINDMLTVAKMTGNQELFEKIMSLILANKKVG